MISRTVNRYMRNLRKNLNWSIKNSGDILDKLIATDFNATSLSTYVFSTLYTTLPYNLITDKLIDLVEKPSIEKVLLTLHVMSQTHCFLRKKTIINKYHGLVKMYVTR